MAKGDLDNIKKQNEALKQRNYLLEVALKTQQESLDLSSSLTDSIKETLGINTKRTTADANLLKVNKDINKAIMDQKSGVSGIAEINKRIAKNNDTIIKAKNQEASLEATIGKEAVKKADRAARAFEIAQNAQKELEKSLVTVDEQGQLDQKAIDAAIAKEAKASAIADKQMESLGNLEKQLVFTKLNTKELEKQDKEREKELQKAKQIEEKLGVAGKLGTLLGKIPGVGKFASKAVGDVTKELEKAAEAGEELPSKGRIAAKVFGKMTKNLAKDLVDPFTIATAAVGMFVKALMEVDKSSGEFAKNQGISYKSTLALREEMSKVATSGGDLLISSKELMNTQSSLNQFFGSSVKFTGKMAMDMASIAKRTNMSEESQGVLALETLKTGKGAKDLLKNMNLQTLQLNKQKGLNLSFKQVQDAIGKTSKSLQLTLKGSTQELVKAVFNAKALGTNLDQVENIASSLLDFESSIQAELEAELLLGKEINLEKARQAALEGDMATVADEVLKNKAIMNAFETKNVVAQEAAAKALGMNRSELAAMVMEQQKLESIRKAGFDSMSAAQNEFNRLRDQGLTAEEAAAQVGDKALADQMESASQAEKMEAIMARIQEIFVQMATPVLDLIDGFLTVEGAADRIKNIMKGIVIAVVAIKAAQMALNAMQMIAIARQTTMTALKTGEAVAATTVNAMSTFGVGTVIAVAAVAAALAGLAAYGFMNDGVIGPDGGMVVSGPKGSIQLNKEDSVIAGTNLFDKDSTTTNTEKTVQTVTSPDTGLIARIDKLIEVNQAILAKSPIIEMAGNEVGQGINTDSRAVQ